MSLGFKSPIFQYEYAISFAGKHRNYAEKIAKLIPSSILFYDDSECVKRLFPGKNILDILRDVYKNTKKIIILNSIEYQNRPWTQTESMVIQEHLLNNGWNSDFIIPIYMDDTKLEYLPSYVGVICAGECRLTTLNKPNEDELAKLIENIINNQSEINNYLYFQPMKDIWNEIFISLKKALTFLHLEPHYDTSNENTTICIQKKCCQIRIQKLNDFVYANSCSISIKYFPNANSPCKMEILNNSLCDIQILNKNEEFIISILDYDCPFIYKKDFHETVKLIVEYLIEEITGDNCKCLMNL